MSEKDEQAMERAVDRGRVASVAFGLGRVNSALSQRRSKFEAGNATGSGRLGDNLNLESGRRPRL